MKNYKRLTFKKSENASNASYDELLNRLVELEDKIENGTLIEAESTCIEEKFDYICKYYENGLCHLGGELFGVPPQLCNCINDFENCMGSKPAKREAEVKVKKDNFNNFDCIVIDGIKFMKENGSRECKTKNIKFYLNGKEIPFEELSRLPQRVTDRVSHTRTEIVLNYIGKDAIYFYTKTEHYTVADGADEEYYEEM